MLEVNLKAISSINKTFTVKCHFYFLIIIYFRINVKWAYNSLKVSEFTCTAGGYVNQNTYLKAIQLYAFRFFKLFTVFELVFAILETDIKKQIRHLKNLHD